MDRHSHNTNPNTAPRVVALPPLPSIYFFSFHEPTKKEKKEIFLFHILGAVGPENKVINNRLLLD